MGQGLSNSWPSPAGHVLRPFPLTQGADPLIAEAYLRDKQVTGHLAYRELGARPPGPKPPRSGP
jgi:hypothetical protein